jgi:hypothetical protein
MERFRVEGGVEVGVVVSDIGHSVNLAMVEGSSHFYFCVHEKHLTFPRWEA